ncbi:hypothetical protein FRC12_002886 [Ceratobasidium sp. 428]|nr:hypothetical protein FRC12_002886 [Ceratobasidium sp. 428]
MARHSVPIPGFTSEPPARVTTTFEVFLSLSNVVRDSLDPPSLAFQPEHKTAGTLSPRYRPIEILVAATTSPTHPDPVPDVSDFLEHGYVL